MEPKTYKTWMKSVYGDDQVEKIMDDLGDWLDKMVTCEDEDMPRGRPAKKEFKSCQVTVLANGYTVIPQDGKFKGQQFVFGDLEQLGEFLNNGLSPTLEGADFLKNV